MKKHTCRQCGSTFEYCRGCLLSPISYKDAGFCSKACYEASKKVVEPIVEEVTTIEIEEVTVENNEPSTPIVEEEVSVEVLADAEVSVETPNTVEEPTIKKETNTYKKKKNKYKYTSSY